MRGYCWMLSYVQAMSTDKATRLAHNSQSLSAAGPDIHESVGASKDTGPSAENTGYHHSLPVITHTFSLRRMSKTSPLVSSFCSPELQHLPKVLCESEERTMEAEALQSWKKKKRKKQKSQQLFITPVPQSCSALTKVSEKEAERKKVECDSMIKSSICNLWEKSLLICPF